MQYKKYDIAIVDDHPLYRIGFSKYIEMSSLVDKIFTFESGEDFLNYIEKKPIDLVFMDLLMGGINGIETTLKTKQLRPETTVIGLSSMLEMSYVERMISAGAHGYMLKTSNNKDIQEAIKTVVNGGNYFSPSILIGLSKKSINDRIGSNDVTLKEIALTKREKEILPLFCAGLSREEIAERVFISTRTIDKHRENILRKTKCKNTTSLLVFCLTNKLIELNEIGNLSK